MRSVPNASRSGLVTLSSSAIGNWTGFSGSSCGDDSQVPGIDINWTSGQLASWNSGRGLDDVGGTAVGGMAPMLGGIAVGGVSGWGRPTTTAATTGENNTGNA